jgi:putative transposase
LKKGLIMPITPELLDELLKDYKSPEDMFGDDGLLQQLTKAVVERALQGEMTHHLGYEKHSPEGQHTGNSRNGKSKKTIKSKRGQIQIDVPRDRASQFEPRLIRKGQTRFDGFDDKIISMYARGMTCREIQAHLQEIYGVEVSPDLISTATDGVIDEVRAWQSRPLDPVYPILYLDALQVKVKDQGRVSNKAIYLAIGVNMQGIKEVLGQWASENEGAKFWLSIITELKNRGVRDIFIACVDGLKGFPESIETIYPKTQVQLCLVHLMRFSLAYVSFKDRKEVAADLKAIYRAATLGRICPAFGSVRPEVGRALSFDCEVMAGQLGESCSHVRLSLMTSGGPSIRPTLSNQSTCLYARSSRPERHSPMMRRRSSCFI